MVEKHRKHCNILYYITVENLIRFIWYFRMHRLFNASCFVFRFLRKTTCVRFGKAGAHPQLALGIAIAPETLSFITTFRFWRQLRFFRFSLRFLFGFIVRFCYLLRKCGLLAHTSAAFLKNCCTEKLFICLRLVSCNQLHIFLFPLLSLVFVKRWIISFTIPYYTTYNTICQPTIVPNFHRSFCAECTRSPTQSTTMFFFTIHFPFCWRFFIEIHKTITKKSKKKKAFRWKIRYHENWGRWHTCQRKKVQTT